MKKTNYWDEMHEAPIVHSKSIESSWPLFESSRLRVRIENGKVEDNLPIDALLVPGKKASKKLIVAFHGAIQRKLIKIPRFEWLSQLNKREEHKLYIADTTLELNEDLTLGWYIGKPNDYLIEKIRKFIEHVRYINEIEEIVLMGSSGGGFASLSVGSSMKKCCSLAYNPQSDIWDFTPAHSEMFIKSTFDGANVDLVKEDIKFRTDLIEQYKEGRHENRFIYYQNTGDVEHVNKHWRRFAKSQGVQLKNGRSFSQRGIFISDFDGEGHTRPPVAKNDDLIDLAFGMASMPANLILEDKTLDSFISKEKFEIGDWDLQSIPKEWLMYASKNTYKIPPESHNQCYTDKNVPLRIFDGQKYDHPVLQAQTGLKILNNVLLNPDDESAKLHVKDIINHLLSTSIEQDGALFFPFKFDWHQGNLKAPWYSAMAQGQVLQLMCRYAEFTKDNTFSNETDKVFDSFDRVCKLHDVISVSHIDENGFLWLEEYPYPSFNKFVLNGHIFASLGVYEYWRLTNNDLAKKIVLAAFNTVRRYIPEFRNPNWSSHYDLRSKLLIRNYHQTHIMQLEAIYRVLGDSFFTRAADTLEADFPHFQTACSVYVKEGKHIGYRADNTRLPTKLVEKREFSLEKAVALNCAVRTKIEEEDGIWLLIEDAKSELDGFWFLEREKYVFPRLCTDRRDYPRPRVFVANGEIVTVNSFNQWASPINEVELNTEGGEQLEVVSSALWNGERYILLKREKTLAWHLLERKEGYLQ